MRAINNIGWTPTDKIIVAEGVVVQQFLAVVGCWLLVALLLLEFLNVIPYMIFLKKKKKRE